MERPPISVVLPTRGESAHFQAALGSVLASTAEVEVLVVFDPRHGGARPSLPAHARIRLYESEGTGPSGARNAGLDRARGDYVAFLDDDDAWIPGHLETALRRFEADPSLRLFAANAHLWHDSSPNGSAPLPLEPQRLPLFEPTRASGPLGLREQLLRNRVLTSTAVLRRASLEPGDRFREELPVMEDYDLWLRLAARGPLWFESRPSGIVRKRSGSASSQRRLMAECAIRVLEEQRARPPAGEQLTSGEWSRRLGLLWHDRAHACLVEGDKLEAARSVRQAVSRLPLHVKSYMYLGVAALPVRWIPAFMRAARTWRPH